MGGDTCAYGEDKGEAFIEGREFLIRLIELGVEKMMRILKAKEFWLFIHLFRTKKINFFNTLKNQLKNLIIYKLSIFLAIFMR